MGRTGICIGQDSLVQIRDLIVFVFFPIVNVIVYVQFRKQVLIDGQLDPVVILSTAVGNQDFGIGSGQYFERVGFAGGVCGKSGCVSGTVASFKIVVHSATQRHFHDVEIVFVAGNNICFRAKPSITVVVMQFSLYRIGHIYDGGNELLLLEESISFGFVSDDGFLFILTRIEYNGQIVVQHVTCRFHAHISVVLHDLSEVGKTGIGGLILDGDGGAGSVIMRDRGSSLACCDSVILHFYFAVFV